MSFLFLALGLVLIVEGLAWAVAPGMIERLLEALRAVPHSARQQIGALAIVAGLILCWIAVQLGGVPLG